MAGGFRFLEHLSDAFIEAWGDSLEEAYAQAAKAFYEVVSSMEGVEPREERVLEVEGEDLQELLFSMLEKLIILFDSEGFLAGEVEAGEVEKGENGFRLKLRLRGERYDPSRHRHGTHVKGVTYHMMTVDADSPVKRLRFLLDI
ncbi:MAG: archease [Thaumarchaeota archaeon]|nr:archease [Nitrososphaerota archaeon]